MTRPDPRQVDRLLSSDPKIIGLLADYVQGVQRADEPKTTPRTSTPKPKIAAKSKITPTEKREAVKVPRLTRKTPSTPTPKPTRKSPRIVVDDPGAHSMTPGDIFGRSRVQPTTLKSMSKTDARSIAEPTPCRFCGGEVERDQAEWEGVWRFHRQCRFGGNARRIHLAVSAHGLGVVDDATALAVTMRVQPFHEEHVEPTYGANDKCTPWGHVDKRELLSSLSQASEILAEAEIPRACILGRCAWCGVFEAVEWDESPYKWADGSDAPLCDGCGPVFARRGEPSPRYMDDARSALAEAMTGVPGSLSVPGPAALLAYVEAEGQGTGAEAWDYLPAEAVEAFRWAEWGCYVGRYAPP